MSTYILLADYTDQGIRNVKESPARLDAAKELIRSLGGELQQFYLTMGSHDMVVIADLPSDESAAQLALKLGSLGNIRTTTLKALSESAYRNIIAELP